MAATRQQVPNPGDNRHRHEVDVEPHAHPGDPRSVIVSDHETAPHDKTDPPRAPVDKDRADAGATVSPHA